MKVKELLKILKAFPLNTEVYISSDSEGNSYGTIAPDSVFIEGNPDNRFVVIYPFNEGMDYEELIERTIKWMTITYMWLWKKVKTGKKL